MSDEAEVVPPPGQQCARALQYNHHGFPLRHTWVVVSVVGEVELHELRPSGYVQVLADLGVFLDCYRGVADCPDTIAGCHRIRSDMTEDEDE